MKRGFAAGMLAVAALMTGPAAAHAATDFVVDDLGDDSDAADNSVCATAGNTCTLRAALEQADSVGGAVTVRFAPSVTGGTITPGSTLTVPSNADLNGCSGNQTSPCIQINGAVSDYPMEAGGHATVAGLAFTGAEDALTVYASVTVRNNWFGIGLTGANGPQQGGIHVAGGDGVTIGGTTPGDRNVFANNARAIWLDSAEDTTIAGNYFGTNNVGTAAPIAPQTVAPAGNGDGISFAGSVPGDVINTVIGATLSSPAQTTPECDGGCNLFARGKAQPGERGEGIDLFGTSNGWTADGVTVQGNFFGLDASGTQLLANEGAAINSGPMTDLTVGGADAGARNVMAGGPALIKGSFAFPKLVENNFLGLNSTGTAAFPSTGPLLDVSNSVQGGNPSIKGNRLGGAGGTPVGIRLTGSKGGSVTGNVLGVGTGGEALPFASAGIRIENAFDYVVGGTDAASENVISNVAGDAIQIAGSSYDNSVLRNRGGNNGGLFVDIGSDGPGDTEERNNNIGAPLGIAYENRLDGFFSVPGGIVRVYKASAQTGSVDEFLGQATADSHGEFTVPFSSPQPVGSLVTANTTADFGASGEFTTFAVRGPFVPPGGGGPPSGGGPPAGGGPVLDATRPKLQSLSFSPAKFRAAKSGASVAGSDTRTGTTITYRLSEPARTTYSVEQATEGRRVGRGCKKPGRSNRKNKKCTIWKKLKGGFAHSGAQGRNTFRFTGRLNKKTLKPGSYRLVVVAQDAAGNKSPANRNNFKIIK